MTATEKPLTMFVHPVTKITKDYGDVLCKETGVTYSWSNATCRAETCGGIELGKTVEEKIALMRSVGDALQLEVGHAITYSVDINPHGFI